MVERARPEDWRACRAIIAKGSKSFYAASLMLPARLRDPAFALYAFCRVSDDAVDIEAGRHSALGRLSARLDAIYAGSPAAHPIDRALADAVAQFAIPRAVFDALLEGFAWDLADRRYHTISEVRAYAARVAGSVGAMMAALMGARAPALLARACDLGVAMQLTNIARDVGEDARAGRLYLPRNWLVAPGFDLTAWMAAPTPHPVIAAAALRLLDEADLLYQRADAGIAGLPSACRPAIRAARLIYAEIGAEVRAAGGDSVSTRAYTSTARKLALAAKALNAPSVTRAALAAPPLPETAYLVDAVVETAPPAKDAARPVRRTPTYWAPWAQADEQWGKVFDLFVDLENRQRFGPV